MGDRSGNSRAASFLPFFIGDRLLHATARVRDAIGDKSGVGIRSSLLREIVFDGIFASVCRQLAIDSVRFESFYSVDCGI